MMYSACKRCGFYFENGAGENPFCESCQKVIEIENSYKRTRIVNRPRFVASKRDELKAAMVEICSVVGCQPIFKYWEDFNLTPEECWEEADKNKKMYW